MNKHSLSEVTEQLFIRKYDDLNYLDAFHPPTIFEGEPHKYKEWHHYIFYDKRLDLFGLLNFSALGDPYNPRQSYAATIALMVDKSGKWIGNFDIYPLKHFKFSRLGPAISLGMSKVFYENGIYSVHVEIPNERIVFDLKFIALSLPVTSEGLYLGSLESIWRGWVGIPRLRVDGKISVNNRTRKIVNAVGYHDHNWGKLEWGDPIAWDAGIVLDDLQYDNNPLTVSFLVDRSGAKNRFHSGALFIRERTGVKRVFTYGQLRVKEAGLYNGPVARFPGTELITHPDMLYNIPQKYIISGADNEESASLEFKPVRCCQIIASNAKSEGITIWCEMYGKCIFHAELAGKSISYNTDCHMEMVRAM